MENEAESSEGTKTAARKSFYLPQKIIFRWLSSIQTGSLLVADSSGVHAFGRKETQESFKAEIRVYDMLFYKKILLRGMMGAAQCYLDGDVEVDNLTRLIDILSVNARILDKFDHPFVRWMDNLNRCRQIFHHAGSDSEERIFAGHDALESDFFKLFLDPGMMYSCALYEPDRISLEQASLKKMENICQQLQLKPADHILEIGTGWGGFALYAARKYGCKVTATTVADKQYDYVKKEITHLGLQGRIELLNQDYQHLRGQYDKLVSIEMIEKSRQPDFNKFFHACDQRLKPDGLFFLQSVTVDDRAYEKIKNQSDFIRKYIFPEAWLPSVHVISQCIAGQTNMQLLQMRDIGRYYAVTLLDWHRRFNQHIDKVREMGCSEKFIRLWRLYLCSLAAGFKQTHISAVQGVWRKRNERCESGA